MTSLQLPKKMIQTFRFIPRKKGFLQGFITVLSSLVIGVFPPLATIVQAQTVGGISIDQKAAGPNQASLSKSSNNAVIVNIVPANGHGLSHNKYISFSVGRSGAVLNNSLAFSQNETSLGGLLSGNPNLRRSDQLASVILNEVTSDKRSRFYGLLEVAGQQASVIIANPNGIGCNGCGFLNTPHGTLTTGNPIIKGGALQGFDVIQGQVKFGGKKANFSNADVVDVIARSIFLDSQVHGRTLRLLAGRNLTSFSADGDSIEHTALETAAGRPKFGIKTNSIGGMYGDQITMVSTDKGLAVHAYGEIFAGTGGVSLSSDGEIALFKNTQSKGGFSAKSISNRIRFKSVSANGDALIDAKTNALLGSLEVGGDIEVTARKNGLRFNKIAANGSVTLTAKKAVWLNKGEKGLNANIYSGDTVTIAAGTFIGIDRVVAENGVSFLSDRAKAQIIEARKGSVTLTARKKGIEADSILSGENIIIRAQGGNITAGLLAAGSNVELNADFGGARIESLAASGKVDAIVKKSFGAVSVAANDDVNITAKNIAGLKIASGANLDLESEDSIIVNQIKANELLKIVSGNLVASTIQTWNGNADVNVSDGFTADELVSGKGVSIDAGNSSVAVLKLISKETAAILANKVNLREAMVGLDIAAYSQTGVMNFLHGADLEISTSTHGTEYLNDQVVLGDILTSGSTLIEATGDVSYQDATTGRDIAILTAGDVDYGATNTGGHFRVKSEGTLDFSNNSFIAQTGGGLGKVTVGGVVDLEAENINLGNSDYSFSGLYANAEKELSLATTKILTFKNTQLANGNIVLSANTLLMNKDTRLDAEGSIVLNSGSDLLGGGMLASDSDILILSAGKFVNGHSGGSISAGGSVIIGKAGKDNAVEAISQFESVAGDITSEFGNIVIIADQLGTTKATNFVASLGGIYITAEDSNAWQGGLDAGQGLVSFSLAKGDIKLDRGATAHDIQLIAPNAIVTRDNDASDLRAENNVLIAGSVDKNGVLGRVTSFLVESDIIAKDGGVAIAANTIATPHSITGGAGGIGLDAKIISLVGGIETTRGDLRLIGDTSVSFTQALDIDGRIVAQSADISMSKQADLTASGSVVMMGGLDADGNLLRSDEIASANASVTSQNGDVIFASDNIEIVDVIAGSGNVVIDSDTLLINDVASTKGTTFIQANDSVVLNGAMASGKSIEIVTSDFFTKALIGDDNTISAVNNVIIAGGFDDDGNVVRAERVSTQRDILSTKGSISIAGNTTNIGSITAAKGTAHVDTAKGSLNAVTAQSAFLKSDDTLALKKDITVTEGIVVFGKNLDISGDDWSAGTGGILIAGGMNDKDQVSAATNLINTANLTSTSGNIVAMGGALSNSGSVSAEKGSVQVSMNEINKLGDIKASKGSVAISAKNQLNSDGDLLAGDQIVVLGKTLNFSEDSKANAGKDIFIGGRLDEEGRLQRASQFNSSAKIASTSGQVVVTADSILNYGGLSSTTGGIAVKADKINHMGDLDAGGSLHIEAVKGVSLSQNISSGGQVTLMGQFVNTGDYNVSAESHIVLARGADSEGTLLNAKTVTTNGAILAKDGAVVIGGETIDNSGSYTAKNGDVLVSGGTITNLGAISANGGDVHVTATTSAKLSGNVTAKDFAAILAPTITNSETSVSAGNGILFAGGVEEGAVPTRADSVSLMSDLSTKTGDIVFFGDVISNLGDAASGDGNIRVLAAGNVAFGGLSASKGYVDIRGAQTADLNGDILAKDSISVFGNKIKLVGDANAGGMIAFSGGVVSEDQSLSQASSFEVYDGDISSANEDVIIYAANVMANRGVITSKIGDILIGGNTLSGSTAFEASKGDVFFQLENSLTLKAGANVTAGGNAVLIADKTLVNSVVNAVNNLVFASAIDENQKPVSGTSVMIGSSGSLTTTEGNTIIAADLFGSSGSVSAVKGAIGIWADSLTDTGNISSKKHLVIELAGTSTLNINGSVSGGEGTALFANKIAVASGGTVKGGGGAVYLGGGVNDENELLRANSVTNSGVINGENGDVRIAAETIKSSGTLTSGTADLFLTGGTITTAALSGGKIGLIADKDINLQGNVTALDRFLAKSDEADVHVGSFYYKVDVTAAAVSLSAGDKVFVHQSVVDARGSAEFGIKGDLFIHSNDDIIVESKHWHDTRVEERQNYKKTIWDNKNIISELKASNDIGLFSKEGDFDFKSSKMTAGNGIVGSFGGGIYGAARQHGEAYELYQDGQRITQASGYLPVQIIATSNSLASREKLDVDTLDRLSAEEAENGLAKFRETSGKGNIVLRANDSVIMNGPKIKSGQIVSILSKEGKVNMSDVPIFSNGYNGGELTHSINPGDWNIVGYYTSEIYGDEGVQLLAPNGAVTLYGGHIMSGNGNVVLAGKFVNLKPTTNVTQFTTSSASGGLFSSSTFSSSFYQESSNPSVVIAGGDLLISGTQGVVLDTVYLQSGDDMLLTAGYDLDGNLVMADASVVFNASKDVTHMSQSSSETGLSVGSGESWFSLFGHESSSTEAWMENVSASQAIAGGNLVIKASGDIYSEAAQLAAVGNVGLEAGGNITLSTVMSESWMQMSSSSWSFGIGATLPDFPKSASFSIQAGLQASNSGTNLWNLTHVGTQIAAGTSDNPANVVMLSGGDTTIEGSVVTATGNIMIDAEGNVTIADVHNQSEIENYSDYTFVGFTIGLSNPALDAVSAAYNSFTSLQTAIEDAQSGLQNVNDPLSAISGAASIAQVFNATQNFQNSLTTLQGEVEKYAAFVKKDQNGLEELVLLNIDASFGIEHSSNFTNTQSTTSQGSALFANGNISIDTALDFNFIGSDIAAGGDVGINAGGSVNLVNGTDTTESQTGSNSFEFNVGLTASINGVLQGSIGSFYANANFQVSQGNSGATTSVPATISGTNVAINAGGDITGVGTLIGGENIYLTAGKNISFLAAENSSFSSGNSFGAGFGVTAPVMAGNITGYGFSFDTNISQSQSSSSTFVNSLVSATGELEVTSGGDTNLIGAIFQGKDVVLDVGGNLNIESMQNTAQSSSFGLNLGFGLGTNAQFKPTNVSFDFGIKGQAASMAWVEQQSGIIGSGSVNVTVGGNTDLVGGVISSGGLLTLDTGSLTFSNIYDHKFSAGGFFNLGNLTYEFGSSDTLATQFADHFNILTGKWDAGFEFYDIRQTTSATISGGSVTINGMSGLPSGLNTNIALSQQITSNVSIDAMSLISDIREIYKARENFNTLLSAQ